MRIVTSVLVIFCGWCGHASAQSQVVHVWPGVAPGSETWTQKEQIFKNTPVGTVALGVVDPTLTVYLPNPKLATGTGVIVAPGGYCVALALSQEGSVAQWLQAHGIAAFVLKYRVIEKKQQGVPTDLNMDEACKYGIADGIQAVKVVRQHAAAWHLAVNRIGFIGFSAGGMVASGTLLQADAPARPDFAAFIYGAPFGAVMPPIPAHLPPVFMAWAQDDPIALQPVAKFYAALRAAGNAPEAHIFNAGGHGFGMRKQSKSSDHWIDEFYFWLQANGFTKGR